MAGQSLTLSTCVSNSLSLIHTCWQWIWPANELVCLVFYSNLCLVNNLNLLNMDDNSFKKEIITFFKIFNIANNSSMDIWQTSLSSLVQRKNMMSNRTWTSLRSIKINVRKLNKPNLLDLIFFFGYNCIHLGPFLYGWNPRGFVRVLIYV